MFKRAVSNVFTALIGLGMFIGSYLLATALGYDIWEMIGFSQF